MRSQLPSPHLPDRCAVSAPSEASAASLEEPSQAGKEELFLLLLESE